MENKNSFTMDNQSTAATTGGVIMGIGSYMLHFDWSQLTSLLLSMDLWQILLGFSLQMLKVGIAGIVGGACGKFGGKLFEKYFPPKTKRRSTKS